MPKSQCQRGFKMNPSTGICEENKKLRTHTPRVSANVRRRNTRNLKRGNTGGGNLPFADSPACSGEAWSGCYTPYLEGCSTQYWDSYCKCMKDYYDAIGQSTWWEDGEYHCSHSGNDWPPCLSAVECFNQGWYKNCTCMPTSTLGGSGCPSYHCYGCHSPGSENYVEGFGFQYYYYPSWFIDNCIPPFAWESGGGTISPPKGWVRKGGRIKQSKRRGGRLTKSGRDRNPCPPHCLDPGTFSCYYDPSQPDSGWQISNQCTSGAYVPHIYPQMCSHYVTNSQCLVQYDNCPPECYASIPTIGNIQVDNRHCQRWYGLCYDGHGGCKECERTQLVPNPEPTEASSKDWGRKGGKIKKRRRR